MYLDIITVLKLIVTAVAWSSLHTYGSHVGIQYMECLKLGPEGSLIIEAVDAEYII